MIATAGASVVAAAVEKIASDPPMHAPWAAFACESLIYHNFKL